MYQCLIPPRVFLAVGVGLLIFSLVLGWISFAVPDWLQFYERNGNVKSNGTETSSFDEKLLDLKKFGLWYKCTFAIDSNDFICTVWNKDAPSFVRVAQVLIPFGLSLGCLALLSSIIGFMSRRAFITTVLFAALFAFLSFIFTTIGVTVFATESLVYVERLRVHLNENSRRWAMWLIIPNLVLSFLASVCFILASIFNWCDYRSMQVTGILSHTVDKYGDSVFKAPSESNITTGIKKQPSYLPQSGQDYPNACYQMNGSSSTSNPQNYPPPPSYGGQMGQQNNAGNVNPAYFGYSRSGSPISNPAYPHSNFDPYHHRNYITENSEMDDFSGMTRSRRRSRSRRHSGHRSRSNSPRDHQSSANHSQDNANNKQTQFIPIPIPYYQPQPQAQAQVQPTATVPQQSTAVAGVATTNQTSNVTQPLSYLIQQPKPQYIEDFTQTAAKTGNVLAYAPAQKSVLVSNPTQPVYTIAYRANNGGSVLTSNIVSGPAAATYVTARRNPHDPSDVDLHSIHSDSDGDENAYRTLSRPRRLKKINVNEAWTWRKC